MSPPPDRFSNEGLDGPIRVLSSNQSRRFLRTVSAADHPAPLDWFKGHAATSPAFYEIATLPSIVDRVTSFLGPDVMLWGASVQSRQPDAVHAWHADIESSATSAKTVAVWIGLENTSAKSSLLFIPYSQLGPSLQEVRYRRGKSRDEVTDDDVLEWAGELDNRCRILRSETTDGEAVFFDGRIWHASHNLSNTTRHALLLQYSTPQALIRIPDLNFLDWPFRQLSVPRPPCILLRGSDEAGRNRLVPAPLLPRANQGQQSTSRVHPASTPLGLDAGQVWKPFPIFSFSTAELDALSCHISALGHNESPHPPHRHDEEELLLLLAGEVELVLEGDDASVERRVRLEPGQMAYYPAHFAHTLRTLSEGAANYLMLKWSSDTSSERGPLLRHDIVTTTDSEDDRYDSDSWRVRVLLDGPTQYLRRLRSHVSVMAPGAGYDPHVDAYDVALVVLEGEVETLGQHVGPHAVVLYRAGEPHGMRNVGDEPAKYVVVEFHARHRPLPEERPRIDVSDASVSRPLRGSILIRRAVPAGGLRTLNLIKSLARLRSAAARRNLARRVRTFFDV